MPGSEALLYALNLAISLAFTTVLFAMIFKLMPTTPVAWRDVWVGAVVTAILFEAGKLLIGLYIGKSGITESFEAAGSIVVLLAWVYYAAQIFLLGAEFTKVYANEHGSTSAARAMDETKKTAEAGATPVGEAPGALAAIEDPKPSTNSDLDPQAALTRTRQWLVSDALTRPRLGRSVAMVAGGAAAIVALGFAARAWVRGGRATGSRHRH